MKTLMKTTIKAIQAKCGNESCKCTTCTCGTECTGSNCTCGCNCCH